MKKQYYHQTCLDVKEKLVQDRKELIEYICDLYGLDVPTGIILKQIKDYQEQFNYTSKGMALTLQYFYETLGNTVREGDGVGIIPYMYEEAKRHYITKMRVEASIEEVSQSSETKVVEIQSPRFIFQRKTAKIDINTL